MNEIIDIDAAQIVDWDSFHTAFAEALKFPDFYGRNGNAWIDCLTYDDDGMSVPFPRPGGLLVIRLGNAADFAVRCPDQLKALISWTAAVNDRRREDGTAQLAIAP
jgi:hypothetical protein